MKNSIVELNEREIREINGGSDLVGALIYGLGLLCMWTCFGVYGKFVKKQTIQNQNKTK